MVTQVISAPTSCLAAFIALQRVEDLLFNSLHPLVPILSTARLKMPLLVVQRDYLQLESLLLHLPSPALGVALHPPVPLLHIGGVPTVLSLLLLLPPTGFPQHLIAGQGDLSLGPSHSIA